MGGTFRRFAAKLTKALAGLPFVAVALLAAPAAAQDLPKTISPLQVETDRNGINFATGKMAKPALTLSVPGSVRLKFDLVGNAAPYVSGKRQIALDSGDDLTAQHAVHTAEGSSEGFTCSWAPEAGPAGKACRSSTGTGSMLVYNGTDYRRAGSGERYTLNVLYMNTPPNQSGNPDQSGYSVYYASKIEYPDGEIISYTYDSASISSGVYPVIVQRPTRISSSLGFFITVTYEGSDPTLGSWYSPTEAAIFSSAAPTAAIQRFTYSSGGTTDIAGRYYAGYGAGTLGSPIEVTSFSQTLPGETAPAITTTVASNAPLVGQVVRDGVSWSYTYQNPFLYAGETGDGTWHFERITRTGPNGDYSNVEIQQIQLVGSYTYQNQIRKITDALGRATTYDRDPYLRVTKVIYPESNSAEVSYDDAGNVVSRVANPKPGSGLSTLSEQAYVNLTPYYNSVGILSCRETVLCYRLQWYRDAKSQQTDFVYNTRGQITEMIAPADQNGVRQKSINEYQEIDTGGGVMFSRLMVSRTCGVGTTCGVSDDTRTEYQYWGNTNLPSLVRQIDPATGQTRDTAYTYDVAGRVLSVDGPLGGSDDTQHFRYDVLGRKTWEIGALGPNGLRIARRTTYRDADDKVIAVETGTLASPTDTNLLTFERADMTYDSRRNVVREARSAGGATLAVTDRSFLDRGLAECATTRMNLASLPTAGSACAQGPAGSQGQDRITKNVYDAAGQLVQVREGVATSPSIEAAEATFSYTANGKKQYVIDANGNRAQLTWDGHDRQVKWTFPSTTRPSSFNDATQATALASAGAVNSADYEQYDYDLNGNRTSLRKRDGSTLTYTYDALNRMTVKTVPERTGLTAAQTKDVYYDYDHKGLMTKARFDSLSGDGLASSYNGFGELVSSSITMSGMTKALSYTYDKEGKRLSLTHPDGQVFTYTRDSLGRLASIYETSTQSAANQLAQASWDNRGLIASLQRATAGSAFATGFTFDGIGRLSSLAQDAASGTSSDLTIGQGFSPASQIISQTRSNDGYAWTGSVTVNRAYTTNGLNQYTVAGPASFTYDANGNLTSDGSSTFVYDIENRLVTANGGNSATLVWDPMGRLWQVTGPTSDTRFLYDGDELVAEYDSAGTLARRYVHSDNVDDPLVQYSGTAVGSAARTFLMPDERGSIVGLIDSSGTATAKNSYDEYGLPAGGGTTNTNQGRFQYTGQIWLPELGMYHYKARIYSPKLGRFLQVDPIGYDDQINLYGYVGNDPINMVDPDGAQSIETFRDGDPAQAGASGMPNYRGLAIVSGHGYEDGRVQMEGKVATPIQLYKQLAQAGYKKGTPIILLNCNTARGDFAIALAKLTASSVYAAGGYVRIPGNEYSRQRHTFESYTGRNKTGEKSGWIPFKGSGPSSGRAIESIRVTNGGKTLSVRYSETIGTRIRQQSNFMLVEEKNKK